MQTKVFWIQIQMKIIAFFWELMLLELINLIIIFVNLCLYLGILENPIKFIYEEKAKNRITILKLYISNYSVLIIV